MDQQLHWKGFAHDPNCCEPATTPKLLRNGTHTEKALACNPNWCEPALILKSLCTWPKPLWTRNHTEKALHMTQTTVDQQLHWKGSACDPNHCEPAVTRWQRFSKWPKALWTSNRTEKALHVTQTSELAFSKWPKPLSNSPAIVIHHPYGEDVPLPYPTITEWKRQSVSFKVYNSTTIFFYCLLLVQSIVHKIMDCFSYNIKAPKQFKS